MSWSLVKRGLELCEEDQQGETGSAARSCPGLGLVLGCSSHGASAGDEGQVMVQLFKAVPEVFMCHKCHRLGSTAPCRGGGGAAWPVCVFTEW